MGSTPLRERRLASKGCSAVRHSVLICCRHSHDVGVYRLLIYHICGGSPGGFPPWGLEPLLKSGTRLIEPCDTLRRGILQKVEVNHQPILPETPTTPLRSAGMWGRRTGTRTGTWGILGPRFGNGRGGCVSVSPSVCVCVCVRVRQ